MRLSQIHQPRDIRGLDLTQCQALADEMRETIIRTVACNGGHLSSNLGAVEITLALHRVFDTPQDKIVFDVGHQSYSHKLLTGRAERFGSIRQYGGLSAFRSAKKANMIVLKQAMQALQYQQRWALRARAICRVKRIMW